MTPRATPDADETACVRCLRQEDKADLDRLLWCGDCRVTARAVAGRWGWVSGAAVAAFLSGWIWLVVQPDLLIGAWVGTVVASFWLGAKVAREVIYGALRLINAPTVEAVSHSEHPPEDERRVRFH